MGPDLHGMLDRCDGALLIGDRALESAREYPDLVELDLGLEKWKRVSGHPMFLECLQQGATRYVKSKVTL